MMDKSSVLKEELIYEILSVVEEIPSGNVATYGQIARLIGQERNARLVGKVLSMAQYYGDYPCHRVVNHAGRLVPGWREQRFLLEDEGVRMKDENHVDLKLSLIHIWCYKERNHQDSGYRYNRYFPVFFQCFPLKHCADVNQYNKKADVVDNFQSGYLNQILRKYGPESDQKYYGGCEHGWHSEFCEYRNN